MNEAQSKDRTLKLKPHKSVYKLLSNGLHLQKCICLNDGLIPKGRGKCICKCNGSGFFYSSNATIDYLYIIWICNIEENND